MSVSTFAQQKLVTGNFRLNFNRHKGTTNYVIYDYYSVMHYPPISWSRKPYLKTVVPKKYPIPEIGQRSRMSPYDIEEVKMLYDCAPGTYHRCGQDFIGKSYGSFNSPNFPGAYPQENHCTWKIIKR